MRGTNLAIETEQEEDGRWLVEVPDLHCVLAHAETRAQAISKLGALALRVLADRLEHGEPVTELGGLFDAA